MVTIDEDPITTPDATPPTETAQSSSSSSSSDAPAAEEPVEQDDLAGTERLINLVRHSPGYMQAITCEQADTIMDDLLRRFHSAPLFMVEVPTNGVIGDHNEFVRAMNTKLPPYLTFDTGHMQAGTTVYIVRLV